MKKSLLILIAIFTLVPLAKASHVIGGDIQIEWVSQNNYRLKLRFYRDDITGLVNMPASMNISVYDQVTNAFVTSQTLNQTSLGIVNLGDPCYTPDPTVVRIEEGIYESSVDLFLADNPNGYYLSATENARNSLSTNVQTGGTMVWLALMADPAIGQNSSPDFGDYPPDAYFCVNNPKAIQYPITDADGDSLAYSFTTPLNTPAQAAYPYYGDLNWTAGYSLLDIIGGATPMTIDAVTGIIVGAPSITDFFTFAVRVEEFRDIGGGVKVKVGETRRDIQYQSQSCTGGALPSFVNIVPTNGSTIQIPYNKPYCKDLIFSDPDIGDTLYIELISEVFDSGAVEVTPPLDGSGQVHYFYNNFNDSIVKDPNMFDAVLGLEFDTLGFIASRFCWTPNCNTVGKTYPFQLNAFSLGCNGKSQDSILFNIEVVPPLVDFRNISDKSIPYGNEYCKSIMFEDTSLVDLLDITLYSDIFNEGGEIPDLDINYVYTSFEHTNSIVTGVPNDGRNTQRLATRFCWTPDCQHIGSTYNMKAVLTSIDCPEAFTPDTVSFDFLVTPPFDSLDVVPNVFTPNGDGVNDVYRIGGVSNPCNDAIKVQIFSRWGTLVFESEVPTFEWDGTNKSGGDAAPGTYFVLVSGIYGSETVTLDQRTVTILR